MWNYHLTHWIDLCLGSMHVNLTFMSILEGGKGFERDGNVEVGAP